MFKNNPFYVKFTFALLLLVLFFYSIIQAKEFLYPIVLAVLFGYLLYPIVNFLEKRSIPRIPASIIAVAFFVFVVGVAVYTIYKQAGNLLDNLPVYRQKAMSNIDGMEEFIQQQFGIKNLRLTDFLRLRVKYLFEAGNNVMNHVFTNVAGTVFRLAILPIFIFLFLYYRTKLAYFIMKMVSKKNRPVAVSILSQFATVVPRYMGGVSTVVVIIMIFNSLGLYYLGFDNPIIFGVISGLFAFIPYFGVLIGGAISLLFALLTGDNPLFAFQIAIFYLIVNFIENNILTPNIVGGSLRLNPMVIIIGIIGAGTVWGIPGMFAIVPLLAMFNIVSEHIPRLNAYHFLLGEKGTRKHALTAENISNFFKRLKTIWKKRFRKKRF